MITIKTKILCGPEIIDAATFIKNNNILFSYYYEMSYDRFNFTHMDEYSFSTFEYHSKNNKLFV